jgi:hypothetical protein
MKRIVLLYVTINDRTKIINLFIQNLQSSRVYKGSIVFSNLFDFEHYFEKYMYSSNFQQTKVYI